MPNKLQSLITGKYTPLALAFTAFLLMVILGELLVASQQSEIESKRRIETIAHIASLRANFEREINSLIYLNSGLGSYLVVSHKNLHDKEVNDILALLYQSSNHIKNFGVAVGYRIKYIYPIKGNEKAIGMYYPDHPDQWPAIQRIINSGEPNLIGPIKLIQGGTGLIYRAPIIIDNKYWGLLSTVINADSLLDASFAVSTDKRYQLAIRNDKNIILGNPALFDNPDAAKQDISIPGGQWEMAALKSTTGSQRNLPATMRMASILMAGFISWLIYHLAQSRKKYNQLSTRLGGLYELSPLGIALTDMQGKYIEFNKAFEKICGYSREELIQLDYWELTPKEYAEQEAKQLESLRASGFYGPYEKEYIRKDQSRIPLRLNGLLLRGIDDKDYIWSIVEDISETHEIDKMKNEFVSTVSHELRTPLTSISGALGLIVGGALGPIQPKMHELLDVAYRNSLRLNHLINDLLDMEKLIAGEMSFNMKIHALLPILDSSIETMGPYAKQYQVEFVQSGCTAQDYVLVDGIRLHQVLGNLLSNAAKFSPAGSKVHIVTLHKDNKLRVSVIDNGPGIPAEFRSRIFQKFSQADSSDTRKKGGTGLGLAISKELMTHMHGTVGYESIEGHGACFYFELPAANPNLQ